MDFITNIKRDNDLRDKCYIRLEKYLNECKRPREIEHILQYIDIELSCFDRYYIGHERQAKIIYNDKKYYSQFTIHLYFPKANIKLIMSKEWSEALYYTAQLSIGHFADKKITFRYYNKKIKQICNGPQIIISMIDPCAIICNNGQNLYEIIKDAKAY